MGQVAELDRQFQMVRGIGDNQAPGPLDFITEVVADLNKFLTNNPVIETEQQASEAGAYVERMRKHLADIEDERDGKVRPLNETVAAINAEYKSVHNTDSKKPGSADKILNELKFRLTDYAAKEEAKRIAAAEALRKEAEAAAERVREAERIEAEAKANADVGEIVDVGAAIAVADSTFAQFEAASRQADLAERNAPVRIGSRMGGKAITMRTQETLVLVSYGKAMCAIGPNDKIRDAILSAARDYRKEHGALPEGVTAEHTRKI